MGLGGVGVEMLAASGTVDDERVTQSFIDSRRRRKLGPRRIEAELRQRGVAGRVVEQRVGKSFQEADLAGECLDLAHRYARRYAPLDDPAQRRKLAQFLLRRGYESGPVWSAVRQLCAEQNIQNEDETPDEA